jgi:hypothetical protein
MQGKSRLELVQRMLARIPESDQKIEVLREWAEILALPQSVVSADAPDQVTEKHRVTPATVMPPALH